MVRLTLPTDSAARKDIPMLSGCLNYAPAAFAGMARWSKISNDKHNPGQPLHHARGKSMDHGDTIVRHLMDVQDAVAALERGEYAAPEHEFILRQLKDDLDALVWRAALLSQEAHEKYFGAPLAPGARLPETLADTKDNPHNGLRDRWSSGCLGEACGFGDMICSPCKAARDVVRRVDDSLVRGPR